VAESVPKTESEARASELESKLSGTRRDLEVARSTIQDLAQQLSQSSAEIDELQGKLSNFVPITELETIKREPQSKIADLEEKLAVYAEKANRLDAGLTEGRETQCCNQPSKV
jgi:chromosome segregation ATPase